MREIKFRAWNKTRQKMYQVTSLFTKNNSKDFQGKFVEVGIDNNDYQEDCILMQFTGLKDKNGKEIYEGDIVVGNLGYYEIRWDSIETGFFGHRVDKKGTSHFLNKLSLLKEHEVIGNIYENPELLN